MVFWPFSTLSGLRVIGFWSGVIGVQVSSLLSHGDIREASSRLGVRLERVNRFWCVTGVKLLYHGFFHLQEDDNNRVWGVSRPRGDSMNKIR
jgi:hypothetical protein